MSNNTYQSCPLPISIITRDRKNLSLIDANDAFHDLCATDKGIIGKAFKDIFPHSDTTTLINKLKSPSPPANWTLSLGKDRWVRLIIHQSEHQGCDVYEIYYIDVSSDKQALEQADAEVQRKANFLATMSHEMRTPMQSVYGLLELIGEESPPKTIAEMVDIAKTSASGLLEILDDVLDFAKMDADKMELDVFEVPVRTLARGILEALSARINTRKVVLKDDIAEDVPFVVIGDPKRLRQVIMNLLGNATKFTEQGTVTLKITRDIQHIKAPKNGVGLRFEIIDTGIGIEPEVCAGLFQAFTQADNSTSRKFGGTGLGLSISKKLVELMSGQIGVESEIGKGSTFWFEIPTEEVSTDQNSLDLPDLEGISILSVEDHPQGRKEILNSLRSMGAQVEQCATFKDAESLIQARPFDVAVVDLALEDGSGLDLLKQIITTSPRTGMIMYTVRDDVGLQHTLKTLGVTYLSKPASRLGLGEAVLSAASQNASMKFDGPSRLLIAEDTESVRDVLNRQLQKLGVEADFVDNGKKALDALKTGQYGILITDLHMPEVDGYGVIKSVREAEEGSDQHRPVIVLTADVQMGQRQEYLKHGFDECLLKPVSLGQFKRLLIRWGILSADSGEDQRRLTPDDAEALMDDFQEAKTDIADDTPPVDTENRIDRDAIAAQMGSFDSEVVEMLGMFVEMSAESIQAIQNASAGMDTGELGELAHSLKGGARSACFVRLGDLAAKLQNAAESGKVAPELVQQIVAEFEAVRQSVQALQASPEFSPKP